MDRKRIEASVLGAIDDVNTLLLSGQRLTKSPETVLFGHKGGLDSLGLVNLIVAVEQRVSGELGISVNLASESVRSAGNPFETIDSLIDYVHRITEEKYHGRAV